MDDQGNVSVNNKPLDEPYVTEKSLGVCEIEFPYLVPDNKIFLLGDIDRPNLIQNNEYRATSKMPILRRF